jgi:hypothetical protein
MWRVPDGTHGSAMTQSQAAAVENLAKNQGWDEMSVAQLGILLWALLRYFVMRQP